MRFTCLNTGQIKFFKNFQHNVCNILSIFFEKHNSVQFQQAKKSSLPNDTEANWPVDSTAVVLTFVLQRRGGVKTAKIEITVMHFQVGYKIGCQIIHAVIEHK